MSFLWLPTILVLDGNLDGCDCKMLPCENRLCICPHHVSSGAAKLERIYSARLESEVTHRCQTKRWQESCQSIIKIMKSWDLSQWQELWRMIRMGWDSTPTFNVVQNAWWFCDTNQTPSMLPPNNILELQNWESLGITYSKALCGCVCTFVFLNP